MNAFQIPDWGTMFVPDASLVESFARGSAVYLALLVLFRIVLKRQSGAIGLPDVMLVVLVSECASQALTAQASSVPNALAAVCALLFWSYALDRLCRRWPWLQRRLEPQPVEVIRDGRVIPAALEAEGLSLDELQAQLRLNGTDDVARVRSATVEAEGTVSVVLSDDRAAELAELRAAVARLTELLDRAQGAALRRT